MVKLGEVGVVLNVVKRLVISLITLILPDVYCFIGKQKPEA